MPRFLQIFAATLAGLILWPLLLVVLLILRCLPSRRQSSAAGPFKVLVTGRMDSRNWCMAHLAALTKTANISELLLVVDGKISGAPGARQFPVPRWIGWFRPRAIARSAWVMCVALREKPHVIMAYSFFPPGVFSLLGARFSGAAAIMQLPGGPAEIEWGAIGTEERLMPAVLTRRIIPLCHRVCRHFDGIIVRGRKAEMYVREYCQPPRIDVVGGSVDPGRFRLNGQLRSVDVVFIGRIAPVKQPDHVCEVLRRVAARYPSLRAVIAGNGPLLPAMKQQAAAMNLHRNVRFAGHVERVDQLLARSRIFLLTSRSEGLSIAMVEAMMAGAVPVVPDVGDLSELVLDGQTGCLISPGDFDAYARMICALLEDRDAWRKISSRAREAAIRKNAVDAVATHWEKYFAEIVAARTAIQN